MIEQIAGYPNKIEVTDLITLRLVEMKLLDDFYSAIHKDLNSEEEYRSNLQKKFPTREKLSEFFKDIIENKYSKDGTPDFLIYKNKEIAGVFQFHPLTEEDHIELGYWLFEEYRNKGILTSVFPCMINFAGQCFLKNKIMATTAIDNIPSQRLLERFQFKKTGKIVEQKTTRGIEKEYEYELSINRDEMRQ